MQHNTMLAYVQYERAKLVADLHQYFKICNINRQNLTRSSSEDETANVNFFYYDIVHVLQSTTDSHITVSSRSLKTITVLSITAQLP